MNTSLLVANVVAGKGSDSSMVDEYRVQEIWLLHLSEFRFLYGR